MKRGIFLSAILAFTYMVAPAANAWTVMRYNNDPFTVIFKGGIPAAQRLVNSSKQYMDLTKTENDPQYDGDTSYVWTSFTMSYIGCSLKPGADPTQAICVAHVNPAYPHFRLPAVH